MNRLLGKTITKITGMEVDSDEIRFYFSDSSVMTMSHYQECCEAVYLEDVNGDPKCLIDTPILQASEKTSERKDVIEYGTYTFYTFRTKKGVVDLRWNGESNGHYSESVDINWTEEV